MIYYQDGVKKMRPVLTREEHLALRNGGEQQAVVRVSAEPAIHDKLRGIQNQKVEPWPSP